MCVCVVRASVQMMHTFWTKTETEPYAVCIIAPCHTHTSNNNTKKSTNVCVCVCLPGQGEAAKGLGLRGDPTRQGEETRRKGGETRSRAEVSGAHTSNVVTTGPH